MLTNNVLQTNVPRNIIFGVVERPTVLSTSSSAARQRRMKGGMPKEKEKNTTLSSGRIPRVAGKTTYAIVQKISPKLSPDGVLLSGAFDPPPPRQPASLPEQPAGEGGAAIRPVVETNGSDQW